MSKDLKKIIKHLVRESLVEIFAEMNLQKIVEGVVREQMEVPSRPLPTPTAPNSYSVRDVYAQASAAPPPSPQSTQRQLSEAEKRRLVLEKMGVADDTWRSIYADTASTNNPILEGDDSAPELVPESTLEAMGLMKDYSKHIGMDEQTTKSEDEWTNLREQQRKILESTIKRTG